MPKQVNQPPGRLLRKPLAPSKPLVAPSGKKTENSVLVSAFEEEESIEDEGEHVVPLPNDERFIINRKESTHTSQERFADGYRDNTYIAGASPPPPSEFSVGVERAEQSSHGTKGERRSAYTASPQMALRINEKRKKRTYVEGQSLLKQQKTRGPDPLPIRPPAVTTRPSHRIDFLEEFDDNEARYFKPPEFTLQDFLRKISYKEDVPLHKVEQIAYSRHNYKKLQKMMADLVIHPRTQKRVQSIQVQMPPELSIATPRVPQKQLIIEMAALIKEQMSAVMNTEMRPVIKALPKWSPSYQPDVPHPHTEIILYESKDQMRQQKTRDSTEISIKLQPDMHQTSESLFHSATARHFQGSRRSNSPYGMAHDEAMITPSELAVLDTLISGGSALSLKAHFISELPEMDPLLKTITYLNLSFNDFRSIPYEVFEIENLTVLKLRNNPIRDIPPEITKCQKLRTLVISFCLVSSLPVALFYLPKLQHLDVAYNKISFIPGEIRQLKHLRELNVEGNQLPAMPAGVLRVRSIKYLRVKNNFMHPLFWKENTKNEPQSLICMAALVLRQNDMENQVKGRVPVLLQEMIARPSQCDCCGGPLYGPGLRMIRPVAKMFGIINLPILFQSCSSKCFSDFKYNNDNVMEMLYGTSEN